MTDILTKLVDLQRVADSRYRGFARGLGNSCQATVILEVVNKLCAARSPATTARSSPRPLDSRASIRLAYHLSGASLGVALGEPRSSTGPRQPQQPHRLSVIVGGLFPQEAA
jgi:hypothetical protein